jgi:hypothetical protein
VIAVSSAACPDVLATLMVMVQVELVQLVTVVALASTIVTVGLPKPPTPPIRAAQRVGHLAVVNLAPHGQQPLGTAPQQVAADAVVPAVRLGCEHIALQLHHVTEASASSPMTRIVSNSVKPRGFTISC